MAVIPVIMNPSLDPFLHSAKEAAKISGEILSSYYGKLIKIHDKALKGDIVTEADLYSEKALVSYFQSKFPEYAILSEEAGEINSRVEKESSRMWVIDPLDGTVNFAHKFPVFAVSIALVEDLVPVVGVVYNPMTQEFFHAAKGQGAYLNDKQIRVSTVDSLDKSLLATGFPYDRRENPDNNFYEFSLLTNLSQGVRRLGSAALDLAYTAAGFVDGYWERGIKPWDVAAGMLLVKEAGGKVLRYDGTSLSTIGEDRILATNGHLQDSLSHHLMAQKS